MPATLSTLRGPLTSRDDVFTIFTRVTRSTALKTQLRHLADDTLLLRGLTAADLVPVNYGHGYLPQYEWELRLNRISALMPPTAAAHLPVSHWPDATLRAAFLSATPRGIISLAVEDNPLLAVHSPDPEVVIRTFNHLQDSTFYLLSLYFRLVHLCIFNGFHPHAYPFNPFGFFHASRAQFLESACPTAFSTELTQSGLSRADFLQHHNCSGHAAVAALTEALQLPHATDGQPCFPLITRFHHHITVALDANVQYPTTAAGIIEFMADDPRRDADGIVTPRRLLTNFPEGYSQRFEALEDLAPIYDVAIHNPVPAYIPDPMIVDTLSAPPRYPDSEADSTMSMDGAPPHTSDDSLASIALWGPPHARACHTRESLQAAVEGFIHRIIEQRLRRRGLLGATQHLFGIDAPRFNPRTLNTLIHEICDDYNIDAHAWSLSYNEMELDN
ncbi:hypothetical protein FISHEDRAFT_69478 [Fistulina hepatica ATCC 64428]|uniref:Uncharacterized protein n=1 Tax=Fistulina hepatica ATCC 64428 TaxID=1128425 RepID=A0A0D7ALA1_9AGAR|nr:hypothetical protein FISHEDRAFT_69478 [Fistulina hepatica ATCC 64428]